MNSTPDSPDKPVASNPLILLAQADEEQTELWQAALATSGLATRAVPGDSDIKITLRIMAAESVIPDLVLVDTACLLLRNVDPYGFASWLTRWLPGARLILTNSAASRITEPARAQAIRRGAMDLLAELPSGTQLPQFLAALNAVKTALRQQPNAVSEADAESEVSQSGSGPLSDAASVLIALRSPGGVVIQDRSYRLKTYPRCFIGAEAVDWLCRSYNVSPQEAVKFGSDLVARRVIHHVVDGHDFKNEQLFYRFIIDEK